MAETFTWRSDGRVYVRFLSFASDDFEGFLGFLSRSLEVAIDEVKDLTFASAAGFRFRGWNYSAVAGDEDEPHVVAANDRARAALIDHLFGHGAHRNPDDHAVA